MKYQKGYSQIQRERGMKRLKSHLLFVAGIIIFLLILGLVGAMAEKGM